MDPVPLPGLRLLRRGRTTWQWGLDASTSATTSDPAVVPAHLMVDRDDLPSTRIAEPDRAAVVQRGPERAPARLVGRHRATVGVDGTLGADPAPLLEAAGLRQGPGQDSQATCRLLLSVGEVARERLDRLVADRVPHLVVRLVDGVVTIGPFVVPGETACLRCVDLHLATDDPVYPALVAQHAEARPVAARDGWPEPRDLPLATLATAWAVRDLCTWAEGDRPATWSATVRLEAGLAGLTDVQWLRHPGCSCFWLADTHDQRTM